MNITFGKAAYVPDVGPEMLDLIEKSNLSISMTGDGLVATTHEALEEHISEQAEINFKLNAKAKICEEFLEKVFNEINAKAGSDSVGEIIFCK